VIEAKASYRGELDRETAATEAAWAVAESHSESEAFKDDQKEPEPETRT